MDKRQVVAVIQSDLAAELAMTSEGPRAQELRGALLMFKHLPLRDYGAEDVACPGALIELELNGHATHALIVPQGGGLVLRVGDAPVQVITPQSPLGVSLLGRKAGDEFEMQGSGGGKRVYRVVAVR